MSWGLLPYSQFITWGTEHGLDPGPFIRELAQNRLAAFFALDVVVSALALWIFVFIEGAARGIRHLWLPIAATLLVGVFIRFAPVPLHAPASSGSNASSK